MYKTFGPGALGIQMVFPEAAALGAECGYEGIQVDLGYLREHGVEQYRAVLEEHGLKNGSSGLPLNLGDDREYRRGLEGLEETVELLAGIGCQRCSTYIPSFSDERDFEAMFDVYRRRIARAAAILQGGGIRLGLEFLGPRTIREGHTYEFIHDIEGMLELAEAIGTGNVGLLLDAWHWYTSGGNLESLHGLKADDIVDVHINDAPEDVPLDEQRDAVRCLPGATGVIDIEAFLRHLDAVGYDGPVMTEPFSDKVRAMEPERAARVTMEHMELVWNRAGLD